MVAPAARLGYIDVIKGLVVTGVIVAHAAMTYGLLGSWAYREQPFHPLPAGYSSGFALLATLGLGLLFLVAGMFTRAAVDRGGRSEYVADRLRRLGIPLVAYLVLVMPALNFLGRWVAGSSAASAAGYAIARLVRLDVGPAWFQLDLQLMTEGYQGWPEGRLRPERRHRTSLIAVGVLSCVVTFAVRIIQPVSDPAPINLAAWPIYFALFAVGVLGEREGWLRRVPSTALRQAGVLVVAGAAVVAPLALVPPAGLGEMLGGWHWQSALVSTGESLFTIGLAIWLLKQFQRIPKDPSPQFTRGSFTAYLLQAPVMVLLGVALRPVALPPELKTAILACLGVVACFTLAAAVRAKRGRPSPGSATRRGRRAPA